MKSSYLLRVSCAGAGLLLGLAGCQSPQPYGPTSVPKGVDLPAKTAEAAPVPPPDNGGVLAEPKPVVSKDLPETTNGPWAPVLASHDEDRDKFKTNTVYFEYDSTTIKKAEGAKLEEVAAFCKTNSEDMLQIEGNCDERGTEAYNLSLGERRALAVREYLSNLGVDYRRVLTVTYGAAKPVEPGHNEKAFSKNRRGDIVLLTPKKQ